MSSPVTDKLVAALKLTADRLNDFLVSNRDIFGDLNPSPYGFMTFCSFLVVASYAPGKKRFPNTVIERKETDTEEFKKTVLQTVTQSLLARHAGALDLIENEEEREEQAQKTGRQIAALFDQKYTEYFRLFQKDVERLAEDQKNVYANLSAAFMSDVIGEDEAPDTSQTIPPPGNIALGLCLSTTVSGLMSFFDDGEQ
ncbi:MAG: hypothetical protein AB9866_22510 [Syntrophobacteraceae bacterium]